MTELATSPLIDTQTDEVATKDASTNWWRIGDAMVLALYSSVVLWTVGYHEKWADEAQAWLLARDLDLKTLWFHELRYEGSPGLWHTMLYVAQHVFHLPYSSLGYIGAACAIAGAAVLIFKAPFPRYIRWPLAFTYVMVYQYAVISRPYTMMPLFAFLAALAFKDLQHPQRITLALIFLANTSLHGTVLAGCLAVAYLVEVVKTWPRLDQRVRNNFVLCAALLTLTFVFIVVLLKPTPDVGEFVPKEQLNQVVPPPPASVKLLAGVCGAFLDYSAPSFLFILLTGAWCFMRRKLLAYAPSVIFLTALYTLVHGYAHHHGTIFIAALTGIWIAWPTEGEQKSFNATQRWATRGMVALLLILCAVNVWDAGVTIEREYKYPYSGSEDAAKYLKSVGADRQPMFGFLFGVTAVQAYFDHNIFANLPTAYFHLGVPFSGVHLDVQQLEAINPEYIVAYSNVPQLMMDNDVPVFRSLGYEIVHFSDGYYLYKRAVYQRECYFIFRRMHSPGEQTP